MGNLELGQEYEKMADWSLRFLQHFSSHPANGEYAAGTLVNRYIFHCKIHNEQSIADAVKYDIKMGRKTPTLDRKAIDLYWTDVFPFPKIKVQRALAVSLENNPNICYNGDRRGRLYRYKTTRPSIRARDVAVFISYYLSQNSEEFNIRDLGEEVREWATDFHMKIERDNHTRFYRAEPNKPHLLPLSFYQFGQSHFPFSFNHPDIRSKYELKYDSDLSEWCENVYTKRWFVISFSNILRYLRKDLDCISEGSKRGLWIHKNHCSKEDEIEREATRSQNIDYGTFENKKLLDNLLVNYQSAISQTKESKFAEMQSFFSTVYRRNSEDFLRLSQERLGKVESEEVDLTDILEFGNHFSRLHHRVLSLENPDVVPILLKQLEAQLELMLLNTKKQRSIPERDIPPLFSEQFEVSESEESPKNPQGELDLESQFKRNARIRKKIEKFLGDRPRNTGEILEHINSTMRHGVTVEPLNRTLSQDENIVKVGYIKRSGILSGGYDICEWATRNWLSSNCPGWQEGTPITIDNDGNVIEYQGD